MTRRSKRTIEEVLNDTCGACGKTFKTSQGLSAHQSMSKACAWYKKGKIKDIFDIQEDEVTFKNAQYVVIYISYFLRANTKDGLHRACLAEEEEDNMDEDDLGTLYDFMDVCASEPVQGEGDDGIAGPSTPGPSARHTGIQLDDCEDERVEEINKDAGRVIRTDEKVRRRWLERRGLQHGE